MHANNHLKTLSDLFKATTISTVANPLCLDPLTLLDYTSFAIESTNSSLWIAVAGYLPSRICRSPDTPGKQEAYAAAVRRCCAAPTSASQDASRETPDCRDENIADGLAELEASPDIVQAFLSFVAEVSLV